MTIDFTKLLERQAQQASKSQISNMMSYPRFKAEYEIEWEAKRPISPYERWEIRNRLETILRECPDP